MSIEEFLGCQALYSPPRTLCTVMLPIVFCSSDAVEQQQHSDFFLWTISKCCLLLHNAH